jgi:predicted aspartyl protease
MDTGSDASAVPLELAGNLGLQLLGTRAVQGVAEGQTIRQIFEAFLSIDQRALQKFEVVGWHEDFVLLGRDILNNYHITLDGPNLTFTIAR